MAKAVRIDVVGFTASGRSTVMQIIANALQQHGIAANVHDEEHSASFAVNKHRRIAALVEDGLTVDIHQVFAPRSSRNLEHG